MKKLVLVIISFCTASMVSITFAQSDKKNAVGVHVATNYWPFVREGWYQSISLGIDYTRQLSARWFISGSIEEIAFLSKNKVKYNSWEDEDGTHVEINSKTRKTPVIDFNNGYLSIPVQIKFNLNSHFYFNTGPSLDIHHHRLSSDYKYNTEVGLGWRFGAGYEHEFNNGITLSLNPYLKWSSVMFNYMGGYAVSQFLGASLQVGYKF